MCKQDRKLSTIKLTQSPVDHTPSNREEMTRIYKHKGEVKSSIIENTDTRPRVYVRGRTFPGLSVTRSLGDLLGHHIGVTSEPSFKIVSIGNNDAERFVAVGSDGIWENMTPEEVVDNLNENRLREMGEASEYLCAKVRDISHSRRVPLDDITVIVSYISFKAKLA